MFAVLHSSAGAGKTHALVKHYLGLCLTGDEPGAYRQVLALTFTNKAAGEMKERVVSYLERLAKQRKDDGAIADVFDHLQQRTGQTPEQLAQKADLVLRHMLHHWSDVAIGTIDAFTHRVVRPFARDLQLDHDLRMTTDQDRYLNAAVDALIGVAGDDPQVTTILTEACLQLLHEEQKWDPEKPLQRLVKELQKESSLAPLAKLREMNAMTMAPIAARLRGQVGAFRTAVQQLGKEGLRVLAEQRLTAEELAHGKSGMLSFFRKMAAFNGDWEGPGSNATKIVANGKWHSAKADQLAIAKLEAIAPTMVQLFQRGSELYANGYPTYLIRRAVASELPAAFALHELDRHLKLLKQEDAVAFFSDLTRKVAEVVQDEPVPFIYERMGERYRHFLFDEFQDTSLLQWACLLPLVDNALSTGGSALLVGDAKQAIYRWRNGEVRLFVDLPKVFGAADGTVEHERAATLERNFHRREPLAYNRRSSPVVIHFNNALFGALARSLPEGLNSVYAQHEQQSAGDAPGLVRMVRCAKEVKGEARSAAQLDHVLASLLEAISDGFRPGDVAILVRSGVVGAAVARHLVSHGFAVVSPDGLRLTGDPVVELIIDLLRFMHTGDAAAAARVLQLKARVAASSASTEVLPFAGGEDLPRPVELVQQWLRANGLHGIRSTFTELVARLCHAIGVRPAEQAQVLALLDEVHTWSLDHGPDLGGFIEHWDGAGAQRSVSPPQHGAAVQVMTVHKAKGLEFPVVIMPNVVMSSGAAHEERLWIDPRPAVPELEVALVRDTKALRELPLQELVNEAELKQLDAINLLYVAFTRPVNRLYAMVPEDANDTVSKALLVHLDSLAPNTTLELGDRSPAPPRQMQADRSPLRDVSTPGAGISLPFRTEAPSSWDPADPDPFRSFGDVVHEILARVRHAADLEAAVQVSVADGSLSQEQATPLHGRLRQLIEQQVLRPWFGDHLTVRTEASIIATSGTVHRLDRVVFDQDHVRVLDIKTGGPQDTHHDQVKEYMDLLRQLGHRHVEGALLYIRDGSIVTVAA